MNVYWQEYRKIVICSLRGNWKYTLKRSTHVRSGPAIPVVGMTPEASDGGAVCPESPCSVASHGTRAVKMRFKVRHAGGAPSL